MLACDRSLYLWSNEINLWQALSLRMFFYFCQAKCIKNQWSAICITAVTPYQQCAWGEKRKKTFHLSLVKSLSCVCLCEWGNVTGSCEAQLLFQLISFHQRFNQVTHRKHHGESYCNHYCHMHRFALQMWRLRVSGERSLETEGQNDSAFILTLDFCTFLSHYKVDLPCSLRGLKLLSRAIWVILKNNSRPKIANCL